LQKLLVVTMPVPETDQALVEVAAAIVAPALGVNPAASQPAVNVFEITSGLIDSSQPIPESGFAPDAAVNLSLPVAIDTANVALSGVLPNQEQLSLAGAVVAPVVAPT
jgi:hypothetical protein